MGKEYKNLNFPFPEMIAAPQEEGSLWVHANGTWTFVVDDENGGEKRYAPHFNRQTREYLVFRQDI